ncbi:MAG: hypothetical protein ACFCUX_10170 [Candidatus Methylacidiphilales bacterium]
MQPIKTIKTLIGCAFICAVAMTGWIQAVPGDVSHKKKSDGFTLKPGGGEEGRALPLPKPFLMAGDERFEEVLSLALVPEEQLDAALTTWMEKRQLDERAKRMMMRRLESFRRRLRDESLMEAQRMGLTLTEDQQSEFIKDYWTRRAAVERTLRQKAEAELKSHMETLNAQLKKDWKSPR